MLARFTGLGQSLQLAIPPARLYLRALYVDMSQRRNWQSDVRLSKQSLRDLQWWADIDRQHLQRAIFREATTATLYTDASMRGWGGVLNRQTCVHGIWTREQRTTHITYLELLAIVRSVTALLPRLANRRTLLFCDNQAVVHIIRNFTSRAPLLMTELRNLVGLCEQNNSILEVHWCSTDVQLADEPSRRKVTDHWKLDPQVFANMCRLLQTFPNIDRFATHATTLCGRWNSPCPERGAEAVDGLSTDWTTDVNWIHPPLKLLLQVAVKLERAPCRAVVVVPFWPKEHWYLVLTRMATEVVVVPHCRQLVCPLTLEVFGIDAPGDWPMAFFSLDPDQNGTGVPQISWLQPQDLLTPTPLT